MLQLCAECICSTGRINATTLSFCYLKQPRSLSTPPFQLSSYPRIVAAQPVAVDLLCDIYVFIRRRVKYFVFSV